MAGRQLEFGFVVTAAGAPGSSDSSMYDWFLEDCELFSALGYRNAWLLEHHFSDYFPTPDPMLLMAHLAGRFPEFSYGTCVLVTPWHNPLRLAGQIASVSLLTDKEMHLGLGRGTAKYEYDAFGLDMAEARARFKETYEILDLALAGEPFSYAGEHLNVPKQIRLRPKPNRERIHFYGAIGRRTARRDRGFRRSAPRSATSTSRPRRCATGKRRAAGAWSTSRARSWSTASSPRATRKRWQKPASSSLATCRRRSTTTPRT